MSHVKTSKCLLAISSRSAVAASAGVPSKGVIVEADSLEKDTGNNIALLAKGLVQAGDETIKDSSSASPRRPGIRGYSFAREEETCSDQYDQCSSKNDCCGNNVCCRISPSPDSSYMCDLPWDSGNTNPYC